MTTLVKGLPRRHIVKPFVVGAAALLGASVAYADGWASKTQPDAPGVELCRALLHRLNDLGDCAPDAIESYPGFSSPPWEALNPEQHIDLIARMIMARITGPAAAMNASGVALENARRGARDFVEHGGILQMWRTQLLSNFGDERQQRAPPGLQTVVQMIWNGTSTGFGFCPGNSTKGWVRRTLLVTSDLSGLDVRLAPGIAAVLILHQPVLYKGRVLFISQTDVFQDVPGLGLTGGLCAFERAPSKR